mmetsp:Transcript_60138/g.161340  ORF Transcript_60138/g.161340 Transcript_60138/m.161340 type:complete len:462 (-) Transcript_60138:69-1454(-)
MSENLLCSRAVAQPQALGRRLSPATSNDEGDDLDFAISDQASQYSTRLLVAIFLGHAAPPDDEPPQFVVGLMRMAFFWEVFLVSLVFLDLTLETLASVPGDSVPYGRASAALEFVMAFIYVFEYFLNIWSSVETERVRLRGPFIGRLVYMAQPAQVIDLLICLLLIADVYISFSKFTLPASAGSTLRVTFTIARLSKLGIVSRIERHFGGFFSIARVFSRKGGDLLAVGFAAGMVVMIGANAMYFAERDRNPEFANVPICWWIAIVTMSTVGYGKHVPITFLGRLIASILAVTGVVLFSLFAGIFSSGFVEVRDDIRAVQSGALDGVLAPSDQPEESGQSARRSEWQSMKEKVKSLDKVRQRTSSETSGASLNLDEPVGSPHDFSGQSSFTLDVLQVEGSMQRCCAACGRADVDSRVLELEERVASLEGKLKQALAHVADSAAVQQELTKVVQKLTNSRRQ